MSATEVEVTARLQLEPDKAWAVSSSSARTTAFVAAISVFEADCGAERLFQDVQIQHSAGPPLVSHSMTGQGEPSALTQAAVDPAKAGLGKLCVCLAVRRVVS
jgi:hypothetical protein